MEKKEEKQMAIPRYIQRWFDALPEKEKQEKMARLSKAFEEGYEEIMRRRKEKSNV